MGKFLWFNIEYKTGGTRTLDVTIRRLGAVKLSFDLRNFSSKFFTVLYRVSINYIQMPKYRGSWESESTFWLNTLSFGIGPESSCHLWKHFDYGSEENLAFYSYRPPDEHIWFDGVAVPFRKMKYQMTLIRFGFWAFPTVYKRVIESAANSTAELYDKTPYEVAYDAIS